jgi:exodeoxyribonuclease III
MSLRIVSYNLRFGGGRRLERIADTIKAIDPDVAVLQEATNPLAIDRLAALSGLAYPISRSRHSVAALSRWPVRHAWHDPPRVRSFLEFEAPDSDLRFFGLHLPSGLSRRGENARLRHVDALLTVAGPQADARTILLGDLNSVGPGDEPLVARMPLWLRLLLRFDGGIRTDAMERLAVAGWVDAFRRLHPDEPGFTLPATHPQVRLDYALVPESVLPRIRICEPVLNDTRTPPGSDHLPLLLEIGD